MQDLRVTTIQTNLYWNDIQANLSNLEEKIWSLSNQTDLIILPEMFTTGFTMEVNKLAEHSNLTTFRWMKQMAAQTNAVICGSYIVAENQQFFNRLVWMQPDGKYEKYDKKHLFRMADEHQFYTAGNEKLLVKLKGWVINPMICYDLRFPVWSRNTIENQYDIAIYIANWPQKRALHWNALLKARAIENLCYTIGVNRVGNDGKGIHYAGDTSVIDMKGEIIYTQSEIEEIKTITLNHENLIDYRKAFPAYLDADKFEIIIN